jgi:RimJ/RimL family protein N-acetyltransferase
MRMMTAPTLTTERLCLRAISMADWEPYATMWADPRVTAFIGGEPRARQLAWTKFGQAVAMFPLFGYGNWAVIDGETGGFIGICGFAQYERGHAELKGLPECGWAFAAESWGRGVATEAVAAVTQWADGQGIVETRCIVDHANAASIRVATRNGYTAFAELPDNLTAFRRLAPSGQA